MKRLLVFALILSFTFPVFAQKLEKPASQSNQIGQLPVKRVILYSHGVGYFERKGLVSGSENIEPSLRAQSRLFRAELSEHRIKILPKNKQIIVEK